MNIDFKKFHKIETDDNCTTLMHPDGHHIKIAHKSLKPEHRKELEKLPIKMAQGGQVCENTSCKSYGQPHPNCKCHGGYAEGGKVGSCSGPHDDSCQYFKAGGMALDENIPEDVDNTDIVPDTAKPTLAPEPAAPVEQPVEPQVAQAPPVQSQGVPEAGMAPIEQPKSPQVEAEEHGAQVSNHLMNEDAAVKSDINAGHIQSKTYKDLFDKKDTLGKISTLFGLLVSGAGSGLSHQPNAVMGMMDEAIKNDLKAQESSAANKQNLLKINQSNLANQAGIKLTEEQAKKISLDNAYMQANRFALDSLIQANNKLPEGSPQRQQGDQMLALLSQHVDQKNASIASQAGLAAAISKAANLGQGNGGPNTQMMKSGLLGPEMKNMGEDIEQKTIPGIPGQAQRPIESHDRAQIQAMKVLSDKAHDLMEFAKSHKGTLSPSARAVAAQKAEEMVNFYNNSIQGGVLTEGRLKWLDDQISKNPTGIVTQLLGNQARLKEIKDSNDHRRNLLLNNYGYKTKDAGHAQEQIKVVDGIKYKRGPGGEAIKVK